MEEQVLIWLAGTRLGIEKGEKCKFEEVVIAKQGAA